MGKLIVVEGLDGSGKATQAALLARRIRAERGEGAVRELSFPNYASPSSTLVKMYLAGELGDNPGAVNAYGASSFYAVDRYAGYLQDWGGYYEAGGILVADRYTTSNAIHQCAKLPQEEWEAFIGWMEDYEYSRLGLPRPDLVIYLDVPLEVSQRLLQKRYEGQDKRDIHERDEGYLAACRAAAEWCAGRLGWQRLACTLNGEMRPPEEIERKVWTISKEVVWNSMT